MTAATSLASSLSSSITGLMMEVALLPSSQLSDARICYEHQCRTCQSQQEETSTHNSAMIYIGSASGPWPFEPQNKRVPRTHGGQCIRRVWWSQLLCVGFQDIVWKMVKPITTAARSCTLSAASLTDAEDVVQPTPAFPAGKCEAGPEAEVRAEPHQAQDSDVLQTWPGHISHHHHPYDCYSSTRQRAPSSLRLLQFNSPEGASTTNVRV